MSTTFNSGDYLKISFLDNDDIPENSKSEELNSFYRKRMFPFANSPVYHATIVRAKQLTKGEGVKIVYDVTLDVQDIDYKFEPGDTVGILPCNEENEVEQILNRLHLTCLARKPYSLCVLKETSKKNPTIPTHIPICGTLHELFIQNLDIRSLPKKVFLRNMVKYTTQQEEIEMLQLLCSPKGSQEYNKFINNHKSLLNVLTAFPYCHPPVEWLLENLPPLQPRPYSISSTPLLHTSPKELHITFSVIGSDSGTRGVCTSWLENTAVKQLEMEGSEGVDVVETSLKKILISSQCRKGIPFYFRKITSFRLPADSSIPIIMIGPGTGVAPFIGFLEHRQLQIQKNSTIFGTSWLFYGCRYSDKDFLYKHKIEQFLESGTLTKLFACFSRENANKVYVQDLIRSNGKDVVNKIIQENAVIYVCGDAKNMAKDVRNTVICCLVDFEGLSTADAEACMKDLEQSDRYIQDVWV